MESSSSSSSSFQAPAYLRLSSEVVEKPATPEDENQEFGIVPELQEMPVLLPPGSPANSSISKSDNEGIYKPNS